MPEEENPWKILDKKIVLERKPYLRVEDHQVQHSSGKIFKNWPWVETPDVICVLAQTAEGEYLTFREIKYALQEESWSIVGGMVEEGESALQAARRELLEETGYISDSWDHLGSYLLDANRGVGRVDLFHARDVKVVSEPDSDDLEEQELVLMTREELLKAVLREKFQILPWAAAIALSLLKDLVEEQ